MTDKILQQHNDPELYKERADAWYYLKRYTRAIDDLNKVIELAPEDGDAWYERGNAWRESNEPDKAMNDYDRSMELDPDNAWGYYCRGTIWFKKEEYDKAIGEYSKFLKQEWYEHIGYHARAEAWAEMKEYDRANARHDKLELDPGLPEEELEIAINDYSHALLLDPEFHLAWSHRGTLLAVLEKYEEAKRDFEKALQLEPNDDLAKGGLKYLKDNPNPGPTPVTFSYHGKEVVREKAASFLDKLRKSMDARFNAKFKKAKGGYSHGFEIVSYDPATKSPSWPAYRDGCPI